jgi:hypothetical protein
MDTITIPSHVDFELSKVKQDSKRFELLAILDDPKACHADRLDLTRFLLGTVGYEVEQLLEIIHYCNHWSNYSQNMTYNQVMSVYRWLNHGNNDISNGSRINSGVAPDLSPTVRLLFSSIQHREIQNVILSMWQNLGYTGLLAVEVPDRGDGRRGFVDVVLNFNDRRVCVEIDRSTPKLASLQKSKFFDMGVFVLCSDRLTEFKFEKCLDKVKSVQYPVILVYISLKRVKAIRVPSEFDYVVRFFDRWVRGVFSSDKRPCAIENLPCFECPGINCPIRKVTA